METDKSQTELIKRLRFEIKELQDALDAKIRELRIVECGSPDVTHYDLLDDADCQFHPD
jgi:hypothetical protein